MAIYNEILVGRFARGIQKLFGIKGGVPAKQLAGEIMPVHIVFHGLEDRFIEGWNRYGVAMSQAAVVGNQARAMIKNPTGSNAIAVVELIRVIGSTAQATFELQYGQPGGLVFATVDTPRSLDGRNVGNSVLSASHTSTAGGGQIGSTVEFSNNGIDTGAKDFIVTRQQEIALTPGDAISTQTDAANSMSWFAFVWRERFLEDSERS